MAKSENSEAHTDGLHRMVKPSKELAAVVGADELTRADITSRMWDYIKKHKLQNPDDGREINADETLEPIFGAKTITMFEMNKRIAEHVK